MMTLYHCIGTRSFRALWLLEEIGAAYDLRLLAYPPRWTDAELERNPLGTVPLLVDGTVALTESVAICLYLASKFPDSALSYASGEPDYASWLDSNLFAENGVTLSMAAMIHYGGSYPFDEVMGEPQRLEIVVEYHRRKLLKAVDFLARHFRENAFAAGSRFSSADIALGYNFRLAERNGFADLLKPLNAYRDRMVARPAYRRAVDIETAAA